MNKESVLVVFGSEAPEDLKGKYGEVLSDDNLKDLIDPGSVEEAAQLTQDLSLIKTKEGERLAKTFKYEGYELWWMHYDDFMYKFCLPFTQYKRLLYLLSGYKKVCLHKPPFQELFRLFLESRGIELEIKEMYERRLPLGVILQFVLSVPFLLWAKLRRPELMFWTNDLFNPPRDHDFRLEFIYKDLRSRKIRLVEFIRSMESSKNVLEHALKRKRPVVYSYAIVKVFSYLTSCFGRGRRTELLKLTPQDLDQDKKFWFVVASYYLNNLDGDILSIRVIKMILKFLNIKTSIITSASSRSFHEVLASKILDIPTVGLLHGAASKNYNVYDFMPEFDGEKRVALDKYGVWSKWWRDYYIKHGRAYKPENLYVSGPIRPLDSSFKPTFAPIDGAPIKVLFVSEQLAIPSEVLPYLKTLMEDSNFSLYFTFRPNRDGFEQWLQKNEPAILERFSADKIIRSGISDAISKCDIVVGSHSTAVLESLLQLKPFVFFHTKKWGDYFGLKTLNNKYPIFASNPEELVKSIKNSSRVGLKDIEELREMFFGDPYENGSKWLVEEALKQV